MDLGKTDKAGTRYEKAIMAGKYEERTEVKTMTKKWELYIKTVGHK